jgi:hypothetical protein
VTTNSSELAGNGLRFSDNYPEILRSEKTSENKERDPIGYQIKKVLDLIKHRPNTNNDEIKGLVQEIIRTESSFEQKELGIKIKDIAESLNGPSSIVNYNTSNNSKEKRNTWFTF